MILRRLSSAVVSSLRTDVTVTTTAQCVTELVLNSIDAGATAIAVRVDLKNFKIQVIDNGCGLSCSDLKIIGTRYMTSKCNSLQDLQENLHHFGFRGEAIASISEVCGTMTIVSRHQDSEDTFCKVFVKGVAHRIGKSTQERPSYGTTITVADFLFNRPVRRARMKPALDLEDIKLHMECIALINPNVSFSLRNDTSNELIFQTQRSKDIPTVFGALFGNKLAKSLVAVEESMKPFKIEGYISRQAHPLKNFQFVFINKRLLLKTKLHKLVNSIMSRSAIIKSNNGPYVPISKEISHGMLLAFSPPKRDKHAIFILNITCPISEYDITLDPKKTLVEFCNWDCILSCLETLVRKFIDGEAGVGREELGLVDSEPPRKLKTLIDEMNQLAREEALGPNVVHSLEDSISTRDLSRAIHSIPANRYQVNLSPSPSTKCMPSTSSSELFSSVFARNDILSSTRSFALTENPYPDNMHYDSSTENQRKSTADQDSFLTDSEALSVAPAHAKPLAVEQSGVIFKQSHPSKVPGRRQVTGFISGSLHFEENLRKLTDMPPPKSVDISEGGQLSPINALDSIKAIRRKKLLNNLHKFSFKMVSEKPLLPKASLQADSGRLNISRMDVLEKFKQSRAVQTSVHQVSLDNHRDKLPLRHEQVEHLCNDNNLLKSDHTISKDDKSVTEEKSESNCKSFDLFALSPLLCSEKTTLIMEESSDPSRIQNSSMRKYAKESLSATDTNHVIMPQDVLESRPVNRLNYKPSSVLHKADGQQRSSLNTLSAFTNQLLRNSVYIKECEVNEREGSSFGTQGFSTTESHRVVEEFPLVCEINEIVPVEKLQNDASKETDVSRGLDASVKIDEILAALCGEEHNHSMQVPISSNLLVSSNCSKVEELGVFRRKIVDYDSSPPSSQESSHSIGSHCEKMSASTLRVKRKNDTVSDQMSKKICQSSNVISSSDKHLDDTSMIDHNGRKSLGSSLETSPVKGFVLSPDVCMPTKSLVDNNSVSTEFDEITKISNVISSDIRMESFTQESNVVRSSVTDDSDRRDEKENQLRRENEPLNLVEVTQSTRASIFPLEDSNVEETEWIEELDQFEKPFYIHRKTGITSYHKPQEESGTFKIRDRYTFLPKGMSPILLDKSTNEPSNSPNIIHSRNKLKDNLNSSNSREEDDFSAIKWGNEKTDKNTGFWPLVDQLLAEANVFSENISSESQVSNATTQELSKSDIKVYNVMFPYSFTKDIFKKLKVLGQLDNKFIVSIVSLDTNREVIVLFDQHAVHERIRVEKLTEDYKQHDGLALWKSSPVDPALPLSLSSIEVRILESFKEKMNFLGFFFSIVDSNTISVEGVPTCLLLRENRELAGRGVSVLRQHLESLIREQVDSILNTRGVGTDHPSIIQNVISSEACRGAVKFGHYLTVEDCEAFLHNLSSCNLPFQCAHGRPALMPILDLSQLKRKSQVSYPNLKKLKRTLARKTYQT